MPVYSNCILIIAHNFVMHILCHSEKTSLVILQVLLSVEGDGNLTGAVSSLYAGREPVVTWLGGVTQSSEPTRWVECGALVIIVSTNYKSLITMTV